MREGSKPPGGPLDLTTEIMFLAIVASFTKFIQPLQ